LCFSGLQIPTENLPKAKWTTGQDRNHPDRRLRTRIQDSATGINTTLRLSNGSNSVHRAFTTSAFTSGL
jgi:hypothetical protein